MTVQGWPASVADARRVQECLAAQVVTVGSLEDLRLVAGVDVHVRGDTAIAAAALVRWPDLALVESRTAEAPVEFPYVPGYLAFRELPAAQKAIRALRSTPDAVLVDGQGLAHPRRFGLACHLGVVLDLPTVGCAKSRLIGTHEELAPERGASVPLMHAGQRIGTVLRTRAGVTPVYVSVGHRVSLKSAETLATRCVTRFRIPEPLRFAHAAARSLARA